MIVTPSTDRHCLGQLTKMARELVRTTLVQTVAARLKTKANVVSWLQSLPQTDDDGGEEFRAIACDVSQRTRLFPDDPNCFERSFAALALLEVLDPTTARMLVTIDRPLRHTGVVERRGGRWIALDLFPRRNSASETGKDVLQGIHRYVGKPLLSFYGLGGVADQLGELEDTAIGRSKKQQAPSTPTRPESRAGSNPTQPKGGGTTNEEKESSRARTGAAGTSGGATAAAVDGGAAPPEAVAEEAPKRWGWA